jgi:hypothetical protein
MIEVIRFILGMLIVVLGPYSIGWIIVQFFHESFDHSALDSRWRKFAGPYLLGCMALLLIMLAVCIFMFIYNTGRLLV